jgi:CheY-like chemotaxis protein
MRTEPKDNLFSVLLVEENTDDALLFKETLQSNPQFPSRVDLAHGFQEALEKLSEYFYHVLLLELTMQDDSSIQLIDQIRSQVTDIPFVLMTPIRDDTFVKEAMRHGVPVIVSKQSGVAEILPDALKVDFWDVELLTKQIIDILYKPAKTKKMIQKNNELVKNLNWDKPAELVLEVYERVLS